MSRTKNTWLIDSLKKNLVNFQVLLERASQPVISNYLVVLVFNDIWLNGRPLSGGRFFHDHWTTR